MTKAINRSVPSTRSASREPDAHDHGQGRQEQHDPQRGVDHELLHGTSLDRPGPQPDLRQRHPRDQTWAYAGVVLKVLLVVIVFAIATYALIRVIERGGGAPRSSARHLARSLGRWAPTTTRTSCATSTASAAIPRIRTARRSEPDRRSPAAPLRDSPVPRVAPSEPTNDGPPGVFWPPWASPRPPEPAEQADDLFGRWLAHHEKETEETGDAESRHGVRRAPPAAKKARSHAAAAAVRRRAEVVPPSNFGAPRRPPAAARAHEDDAVNELDRVTPHGFEPVLTRSMRKRTEAKETDKQEKRLLGPAARRPARHGRSAAGRPRPTSRRCPATCHRRRPGPRRSRPPKRLRRHPPRPPA